MINNLEKMLLEKGIQQNHIEKMKQETNQSVIEVVKGYEPVSPSANTQFVASEKIVALTLRGQKGVSWFDHVKYHNKLKNRLTRMDSHFQYFLQADDLASYHEKFINPSWGERIEFHHYVNDDIFVCHSGNHRAVMAKITDVPFLEAEVKTFYKPKGENA